MPGANPCAAPLPTVCPNLSGVSWNIPAVPPLEGPCIKPCCTGSGPNNPPLPNIPPGSCCPLYQSLKPACPFFPRSYISKGLPIMLLCCCLAGSSRVVTISVWKPRPGPPTPALKPPYPALLLLGTDPLCPALNGPPRCIAPLAPRPVCCLIARSNNNLS